MKIPIPLRMRRKNKSHLKKKRRRSLPAREKNLHLRKMMVTTMKIFRQPSPRNLKKHPLLHVTPNLLHPRRPRFKLASHHPTTSLPRRRKKTHLFHPLKNKLTKPLVHSSKTSSPQAKNRVSNPSLQVYYTPSVHPKTP